MAIIRSKQQYHEKTAVQMDKHLLTPTWSLQQKLALTCRILSDEEHESALAGQITARADELRQQLTAAVRQFHREHTAGP